MRGRACRTRGTRLVRCARRTAQWWPSWGALCRRRAHTAVRPVSALLDDEQGWGDNLDDAVPGLSEVLDGLAARVRRGRAELHVKDEVTVVVVDPDAAGGVTEQAIDPDMKVVELD